MDSSLLLLLLNITDCWVIFTSFWLLCSLQFFNRLAIQILKNMKTDKIKTVSTEPMSIGDNSNASDESKKMKKIKYYLA